MDRCASTGFWKANKWCVGSENEFSCCCARERVGILDEAGEAGEAGAERAVGSSGPSQARREKETGDGRRQAGRGGVHVLVWRISAMLLECERGQLV